MSIYHHPWFMFSHLCGILEYPYLAVWWFYAAFGKREKTCNKSFVGTIFRVETNDLGWHIPTKWRQIFTIGPFQPACTCTLLNLQKKEKKQQKKIWFENWVARQIPVKHTLDGVGGWRPQYQLSIRSPRWWLMTSIRRSAIVAPTSYVTARLVIKARFNPATWTRERGMFFFSVPLKMVLLLPNIEPGHATYLVI